MAEDQVKLTLAVETKDDILYDISRDANERAQRNKDQLRKRGGTISDDDDDDFGDEDDFESRSDDPKIGNKRKFKQLEKMMKDSSEGEDQSYDANKARDGAAKRPRKDSPANDNQAAAAVSEAARNQAAFDSGEED